MIHEEVNEAGPSNTLRLPRYNCALEYLKTAMLLAPVAGIGAGGGVAVTYLVLLKTSTAATGVGALVGAISTLSLGSCCIYGWNRSQRTRQETEAINRIAAEGEHVENVYYAMQNG